MDNQAIPSLLPVYRRYDLAFARGEGAWLYTTDGRRMLDFASGIAVTGLGHAHPHLVATLHRAGGQALARLQPVPDPRARAAGRPAGGARPSPTPCSSAIPVPRRSRPASRWPVATTGRAGKPERHRIVTFEGAFHGRTMAGISAAGSKKMVEGFDPLLPGFDIVPFGDHEALHAAIGAADRPPS